MHGICFFDRNEAFLVNRLGRDVDVSFKQAYILTQDEKNCQYTNRIKTEHMEYLPST